LLRREHFILHNMKGFFALTQFLIVATHEVEDSTNLLQTKADQRRDIDGEECFSGKCKPAKVVEEVIAIQPTKAPYNCLTRETWTAAKTTWCCTHQGRGCPTKTTTTTVAALADCSPTSLFAWPASGKHADSDGLGRITWSSNKGRAGNTRLGKAAGEYALLFKNNGHVVTVNWEKTVYKMTIKYSDADFNEGVTFTTNGAGSNFELTHLGPTDKWSAPNQLTGSGDDKNQSPDDYSTIEISDAAGFNQLNMDHLGQGPTGTNALLDVHYC